jgi:stage II sporulation protein D
VLKVLKVRRVLKVQALNVLPLLAAVALSGCAPGPVRVMIPGSVARAKAVTIRVQIKHGSAVVVREIPLEEYVTVTALSEVHPGVADDAVAARVFEVQAVIARTYALSNLGRHAKEGFDVCTNTHCQMFDAARVKTSRWSAAARAAVQKTAGDVLWFADAPARAVYHADCGGHTSNAAAVWGGLGPPYLIATRDSGPADAAHSEWTFEPSAAAVLAALNTDQRTAVGARLDRIEIAGRDDAGRAEKIVLRGTRTFVVRGEVFRDVLTRRLGVRTLRSTLFSVKKRRDTFVFVGKGFGHGVGLCQAGALARLKAGASADDVLAHYFPGARVSRAGL